jgi:hypothetical protein
VAVTGREDSERDVMNGSEKIYILSYISLISLLIAKVETKTNEMDK